MANKPTALDGSKASLTQPRKHPRRYGLDAFRMIKRREYFSKGEVVIRKAYLLVVFVTLIAYGIFGPQGLKVDAAQPAANPHQTQQSPAASSGAANTSGKVLEVHDASNYTYARVDTGKEKIWLAGPTTKLKVGDKVEFASGMPMKNFESKSLNRTFDVIYFVSKISPAGSKPASGQLAMEHPKIAPADTGKEKMDFSGIAKPKDGKTIAEIYKGKAQLTGKKVVLRGKVVKFTGGVMGKNWLHVKDGTGAQGTNDLTVTTKAAAKIGDTVLVRGTLATDKDYGYGYKYPAIIEDAEVTVER